jgi:hypothetical protein
MEVKSYRLYVFSDGSLEIRDLNNGVLVSADSMTTIATETVSLLEESEFRFTNPE